MWPGPRRRRLALVIVRRFGFAFRHGLDLVVVRGLGLALADRLALGRGLRLVIGRRFAFSRGFGLVFDQGPGCFLDGGLGFQGALVALGCRVGRGLFLDVDGLGRVAYRLPVLAALIDGLSLFHSWYSPSAASIGSSVLKTTSNILCLRISISPN